MPYYLAPDDSIHFLEADRFAYMLPPGSLPISDAEADQRKPAPPSIDDQIATVQAELSRLTARKEEKR